MKLTYRPGRVARTLLWIGVPMLVAGVVLGEARLGSVGLLVAVTGYLWMSGLKRRPQP